ncbi:hypothetical protein L917_06898 [Phytophthora nicotianae]|uniref:Uncharacterized protein n=2 Tax=Phytophthora nicotianae TaxID=4792 RepID=V9FBN5_PHYNI|nr:hypothetical protein F443_07174 [Phytophthora nicotianae P1569]ETL95274.1 hypothetical protein L917_06898 [Phytophthora nicotianae]
MGSASWSELDSPADLPDADDSRRPPRERKGSIPYRMGANMGARSKPSLRRTPTAQGLSLQHVPHKPPETSLLAVPPAQAVHHVVGVA